MRRHRARLPEKILKKRREKVEKVYAEMKSKNCKVCQGVGILYKCNGAPVSCYVCIEGKEIEMWSGWAVIDTEEKDIAWTDTYAIFPNEDEAEHFIEGYPKPNNMVVSKVQIKQLNKQHIILKGK